MKIVHSMYNHIIYRTFFPLLAYCTPSAFSTRRYIPILRARDYVVLHVRITLSIWGMEFCANFISTSVAVKRRVLSYSLVSTPGLASSSVVVGKRWGRNFMFWDGKDRLMDVKFYCAPRVFVRICRRAAAVVCWVTYVILGGAAQYYSMNSKFFKVVFLTCFVNVILGILLKF